jgi:hypothetical protein
MQIEGVEDEFFYEIKKTARISGHGASIPRLNAVPRKHDRIKKKGKSGMKKNPVVAWRCIRSRQ